MDTTLVYLEAKTSAELDEYKGKLKGTIVLATALPDGAPGTNVTRFGAGLSGRARAVSSQSRQRSLSFLAREGAALVVNASSEGEGGAVFVTAASVPGPSTNTLAPSPASGASSVRAWSTNAPAFPPQITLAAEDYKRLVRMIQAGTPVKMAVDLQVQFHNEDLMGYNTIAEIPGSDLQDQIVMMGAHLDSWHAATGATDNGAGVAATMEAVRILRALNLRPRRTIRIGLWSGEEQGYLGARAYVSNHFGYYTSSPGTAAVSAPKAQSSPTAEAGAVHPPSAHQLVRQREYEKLSVYFNLDNGAGKIRGLYLQDNEAARGLFRRWLAPVADLGAETLDPWYAAGTDHVPFDAIGLPAFEFIQDPLDYRARTHHSNQDVLDRVSPENLKQAAMVLAVVAYEAATLDEKVPRKP